MEEISSRSGPSLRIAAHIGRTVEEKPITCNGVRTLRLGDVLPAQPVHQSREYQPAEDGGDGRVVHDCGQQSEFVALTWCACDGG